MKTELKYKNHATIDKHNGRKKTKDIHLEIIWLSKRDLPGKKKKSQVTDTQNAWDILYNSSFY